MRPQILHWAKQKKKRLHKTLFLKEMAEPVSAFLRLHYLCQLKFCFWKRVKALPLELLKKANESPGSADVSDSEPFVLDLWITLQIKFLDIGKIHKYSLKATGRPALCFCSWDPNKLQLDKRAGYCWTMLLFLSGGKSFIPSFIQDELIFITMMQITDFSHYLNNWLSSFAFVMLFSYPHKVDSVNH